jgi:hypothetical protein
MTIPASRDIFTRFAAEVRAAHARLREPGGDNGPGTAAWDAWFGDGGVKDRWTRRPHGRDAAPGDLDGWQLPGEWPHGGDVRCRRCNAVSSMDGHPDGCPGTPGTIEERMSLQALRRCYCGQALVVAPEMFGPCCEHTQPVPLPGGCAWCGSSLCRVNDPDDLPEKDYYVTKRHPEMGDAWVHARCVDEYLLGRHRGAESVARRRAKRHTPLGVYSP